MKLPVKESRVLYVRRGTYDEQPEMDATQAAKKLQEAIESGDFIAVKNILDDVVDFADVKAIEQHFEDLDPVISAIDHNQEKIAVYLVEKTFSTDKRYCYPGEECEPYCYATHENQKCPYEYDALDKAKKNKMTFLTKVISDLKSGKRKAGDSLSEKKRVSIDSTESLERQHFLEEWDDHLMDKNLKTAEELQKVIKNGDFHALKQLLNRVVSIQEVNAILTEYPEKDPVIEALEARNEKIAWYLIEKHFPYNIHYTYTGEECDEWCSRLHQNRTCPNEYTAKDLAKANQFTSVQGLIEGIDAGRRKIGASLKLHRQVSLENMPIFSRDVILETEEYRIANKLTKLIDVDDLEGVKSLIDPITDPLRIHHVEYLFDDRDPVVYAVDKNKPEIADYLIHRSFTFTKPYRFAGTECDTWCYCKHENLPCPGLYTAYSLAKSRGLAQLHQHMTELRQGQRQTQLVG